MDIGIIEILGSVAATVAAGLILNDIRIRHQYRKQTRINTECTTVLTRLRDRDNELYTREIGHLAEQVRDTRRDHRVLRGKVQALETGQAVLRSEFDMLRQSGPGPRQSETS